MQHPTFRKNFWLLAVAKGSGVAMGFLIFLLLARWLGAGGASDAFFLVRRFVTGLGTSIEYGCQRILVPPLVRSQTSTAPPPVRTITVTLVLSGLAALALWWGAEWVVKALAPGFDGERIALATELMRIVAPMIALTVLAAIAVAHVNAVRYFGLGGFAGQLPRLVLILALLLLPASVEILAWALVVGAALYAIVLLPAVARIILDSRQRRAAAGEAAPDDAAGTSNNGKRLGIVGLAQIEMQGVGWIDAAFASLIGLGALSMLEYGQRLMGLLPSLLSASLMSVAYTEMSYAAAAGDTVNFRHNIVRIMRANMFLILPLAVFSAAIADLLVSALLGHGEFSAAAVDGTTEVVRLSVPHLTFVAINSAAMSALIAEASSASRRIMAIGVAVMLVSRVAIFWLVVEPFGLGGLMLGSAASLGLGTLLFTVLLRRHLGGLFGRDDLYAFGAMMAAAAAAGLSIYGVRLMLDGSGLLHEILALALSAPAAAIGYLGVAALLGVSEVELIGLPWRRRARQPV